MTSSQANTREKEDLALYPRPTTISFTAETMRAPLQIAEPHKPEEKISLFWRVFGGTILSITALIAIQAYQAQMNNIHELRADQNRLRDLAADFVKKDELTSRTSSLWNRLQEMQAISANVTVLSTKLATIETQTALADKERKEIATALAQLPVQRDKLSQIDDVKRCADQDHKEIASMLAAMQSLRDKDCTLEKKLLEAESDRKDLTREIQKLRERIAKIEGQSQPVGTSLNKTVIPGMIRN